MNYSESQKKQLHDFVREGLARVVFYMKSTYGLPEEITAEEINKLGTLGEQMTLLEGFFKENPNIFSGMPHFKP